MFFFFLGSPDGYQHAVDGESLRQAVKARATEVLAEVDASPSPDGRLALEAAVSCGYLQLVADESAVAIFPARAALPAAERLCELLDKAIADVESLDARWDAASPEEAVKLVRGLLEARMNTWAALETLSAVDEHKDLSQKIVVCEERLGGFDLALLNRIEFLSTAADTQLLVNWRLALSPAYWDILPWWLDGKLEAEAVRVEESIDTVEEAILPKKQGKVARVEHVEKVRHRLAQVVGSPADKMSAELLRTPLMRWRSSDGNISATLLPCQSETGGLVLEFHPENVDPSIRQTLAGGVAVLGTQGQPIEWHEFGATVADARFSRTTVEAILEDSPTGAPELVVMPNGDRFELMEVFQ